MWEMSIEQQLVVFLLLLLLGFLSGLLFDVLRACGKGFGLSKYTVFLTDLVFCLIFTLVVFQILYVFNWGEVRFYIFFAIIMGLIFYYGFCSRFVYNRLRLFFKILHQRIFYLYKRWQEFFKKNRTIFYRGYFSLKNMFRKDE
jgi:spore cortex biosynthesis protein YabQ